MHFVMHAFSNYVKVLHNVTPIDLLAQTTVLLSTAPTVCPFYILKYDRSSDNEFLGLHIV